MENYLVDNNNIPLHLEECNGTRLLTVDGVNIEIEIGENRPFKFECWCGWSREFGAIIQVTEDNKVTLYEYYEGLLRYPTEYSSVYKALQEAITWT